MKHHDSNESQESQETGGIYQIEKGVIALPDIPGKCDVCDSYVTTDMILDSDTARAYWLCPDCGAANRSDD